MSPETQKFWTDLAQILMAAVPAMLAYLRLNHKLNQKIARLETENSGLKKRIAQLETERGQTQEKLEQLQGEYRATLKALAAGKEGF